VDCSSKYHRIINVRAHYCQIVILSFIMDIILDNNIAKHSSRKRLLIFCIRH